MPNTKYEARIAIYEDKISLGKSTGIISVTTTNGCEYEGEARGLGQFNVGCDQTCQCYQNGTVSLLTQARLWLSKIGVDTSIGWA